MIIIFCRLFDLFDICKQTLNCKHEGKRIPFFLTIINFSKMKNYELFLKTDINDLCTL